MSISINFNQFCEDLKISAKTQSIISLRYNSICKKLNNDFWNINTNYGGIFVGCYGRETANNDIDKIEMIFEMPYRLQEEYSKKPKNGQFLFLEDVRRSIATIYPNTSLVHDEFGIKVCFFDKMSFSIAPVFFKKDNEHVYADPRKGGSWRVKNFRKEKEAIKIGNIATNHNLKKLCRMMKMWKKRCNVPIKDILIDTLAYEFLMSWEYRDKPYSYFDLMCKDFFKFLMDQKPSKKEWKSIGGVLIIPNALNFRYKAIMAHYKAESAILFSRNHEHWLAIQKWKEVFGTEFPESVPIENQLKTLNDSISSTYKAQKECMNIINRRRIMLTILQIFSAIMIPTTLLVMEYTKNFKLGLALFTVSILLFITSLIYRKSNQVRIMLKHKVSAKLAINIQKKIKQSLKDLKYNDIDIAVLQKRKHKIVSKLQGLYKGASVHVSKNYYKATQELHKNLDIKNEVSTIESSKLRIPKWKENKFSIENHVQQAVNYRN
ncbi:SMODS domain-containing nucleotidyltransferase [Aquimarina sp. 2304DJ70-9]|uniref:SMODS domain-containing nucleotidyltransferase n=1 Tax=Aquimarina penaris TaxID=3231044 RepID=UPI003462127B